MEREDVVAESAGSTITYDENLSDQELRRGLVVGRSIYFVQMFLIAGFVIYLNLYLSSIGLTPTQLGVIAAVTALLGIFATPIWASVMDMRQWYKGALIFATLTSGFSALLFLGVEFFWAAMAVCILYAILRAPIGLVLDASLVNLSQRAGKSYGRQRVWGSIGLAAGIFLTSRIIEFFGYDSIFWVQFAGYAIVATILAFLLPVASSTSKVNYAEGLRVLLASRPYRGLVIFMIGYGSVVAALGSYGGLRMLAVGGTAAMIGTMFTIGACIEIPSMFYADTLTRRIGVARAIALAGLCVIVLTVLVAFASTPLALAVPTALSAIFSGIIFSAAAPLALRDAPLQLSASALGIVFTAFGGVGAAIGGLLGGMILDAFGGGYNFLVVAFLMLLSTIYFYYSSRA